MELRLMLVFQRFQHHEKPSLASINDSSYHYFIDNLLTFCLMLNNDIRQRLQQLMTHYGHSVLDEPKRCEALLRDYFPEHKRELNLLVLSLREGIPQQLLKPAPHVGMDFTLQRLAQTLHDDLGMAEQFAFWAVESWALSLQVIQQPAKQIQAQAIQPVKPKPKTVYPVSPKQQVGFNQPIPLNSHKKQQLVQKNHISKFLGIYRKTKEGVALFLRYFFILCFILPVILPIFGLEELGAIAIGVYMSMIGIYIVLHLISSILNGLLDLLRP